MQEEVIIYVKIDNNSFERVEHFKYLGKILTDQNSIQGRLKSGNAYYHSVKNSLPVRFPKYVKVKI